MTLAEHADAFYVDGSLRDLYVLNTTLEHWQRMLDYVRGAGLVAGFERGTRTAQLPQRISDIFAEKDDPDHESLLLRLNVGGLWVNCHFFQDDEIEFDLDPREVTDEQRYEALMGFMVDLGRATGRRVVMTPESSSGTAPGFVPLFDLPIGEQRPVYITEFGDRREA